MQCDCATSVKLRVLVQFSLRLVWRSTKRKSWLDTQANERWWWWWFTLRYRYSWLATVHHLYLSRPAGRPASLPASATQANYRDAAIHLHRRIYLEFGRSNTTLVGRHVNRTKYVSKFARNGYRVTGKNGIEDVDVMGQVRGVLLASEAVGWYSVNSLIHQRMDSIPSPLVTVELLPFGTLSICRLRSAFSLKPYYLLPYYYDNHHSNNNKSTTIKCNN